MHRGKVLCRQLKLISPPGINLQVVYGTKNTLLGTTLNLVCQITNLDTRTADNLVLQLKSKKGWDFVWGSASLRRNHATTNPPINGNMQFDLRQFGPETANGIHV